MPITSTQANVSLNTIQTEFGGTNPISLSEYYRNGSFVPNGPAPGASVTSGGITASIGANEGTGNIPTSGLISISSFRPSSKIISVTVTVSSNVTNMNLWSEITSRLGTINNQVNCTCTINSGVWVSSNSTSIPALTTGSGWPASSTLTIVNNGIIAGMGGAGGTGGGAGGVGTAGSAGGPAVNLTLNTTINNLGSIHGGGGGGGGGGSGHWFNFSTSQYAGGGGGGGGQTHGASSSGGSVGSNFNLGGAYSYTTLTTGTNGDAGTISGGGAGGVGYSIQYGSGESAEVTTAGNGGTGGAWGTAGSAGATASAAISTGPTAYGGGLGGAGGYYLVKNGFSITWTTTGTRSGTEI